MCMIWTHYVIVFIEYVILFHYYITYVLNVYFYVFVCALIFVQLHMFVFILTYLLLYIHINMCVYFSRIFYYWVWLLLFYPAHSIRYTPHNPSGIPRIIHPVYPAYPQSGYGLATMVSEGVLVRYIVPYLGEINSMRLGLLAFAGTDMCTCVYVCICLGLEVVCFSVCVCQYCCPYGHCYVRVSVW